VPTQSLPVGSQLQVYRASAQDQRQILRLLEESRRSFAAFGPEDLPKLLASGVCTVALAGDALGAFLCVSVNRARWGFVRGLAIKNGWRTDEGLDAVLQSAARGGGHASGCLWHSAMAAACAAAGRLRTT
jgi:hypothetical protein